MTLGRRDDHERRRDELVAVCRVAGLELIDAAPLDMSVGERDDLQTAASLLADALPAHLQGVDVVSGPSPRDVHPRTWRSPARSPRRSKRSGVERRLWLWSIWGTLPRPTLWFPFAEELLDHQLAALAEHRSQVVRSDFRRLVRGRAEAASVLGPELLYGFGVDAPDEPYAELLCEAVHRHGVWHAGRRAPVGSWRPARR